MHSFLRTACASALASAILASLAATAATPASPRQITHALKTNKADVLRGDEPLIVKYRDGSQMRANPRVLLDHVNAVAVRSSALAATARSGAAAALQFSPLRRLATGAAVLRPSRRLSGNEREALLSQLRADPAVLYAQVDMRKHALDVVPNDPRFQTLQWDMQDSVGGINGPAAWAESTGEGVVVAVLDTGYLPHRDLAANIIPGYDMVSWYGQDEDHPDIAGDGDGRDADATDPGDWTDSSMSWCGGVSDSSWHGTHVAGTVAALTNNSQDIAGVAHGARVQPVRVLGHCGGMSSDIIDAITWASGGHVDGVPDNATPADVINMSLGGSGPCSSDPATQEAIDGAIARGTVVVVAAGNSSADAANYSPASCKGVVTVGATGMDGAMAWYSNYGSPVTVAGPGGDNQSGSGDARGYVWSTGDSGTTTAAGDNALVGMVGTSMASPHVAGIVALMQSAAVAGTGTPLTPGQVEQMLKQSARRFPVPLPAGKSLGAGLADAARAVQLALGNTLPEEPPIVLGNGVMLGDQAGVAGDSVLYQLEVPAGMKTLNLRTVGGQGDVSLYVSRDVAPTAEAHDYASTRPGNAESVVVPNPAAGRWVLRVVGQADYRGVSVLGVSR